jgi:hypothetical protein
MLNPFSVKYLMGELASGKGSGLTCFLCIDIDFTNVAPDMARPQTIVNQSMLVKSE